MNLPAVKKCGARNKHSESGLPKCTFDEGHQTKPGYTRTHSWETWVECLSIDCHTRVPMVEGQRYCPACKAERLRSGW